MKAWDHIPEDFDGEVALSIGKFDGFHLGHRLLIEEAAKTGNPVAVMTFVFNKTKTIDDREEKKKLAAALGVDYYFEIEPDSGFFSMTPERFVSDYVAGRLHSKYVVVGDDFRFGRDRIGDIQTLSELAKEYDYSLIVVPKIQYKDEDISSSRIRKCIENGQLSDTEAMLGRTFRLSGEVTDGNHIGRQIGVPTANIFPAEGKVCPPKGVYEVGVLVDNEEKEYAGIADFGVKPTVGENYPEGLEVHLIDYNGNLYGRNIAVLFKSFIREEKKFADMNELHRQIDEDLRRVKNGIDKQ